MTNEAGPIVLATPAVDELNGIVDVLRAWQDDDAPFQLHPGDLGWYWQRGAQATAAAVRTWRRDGDIIALGLLDGPDVFRLTTAPGARQDAELAQQMARDLVAPERGVLPAGRVAVEAPTRALVHGALSGGGWKPDEPWTPLARDLSAPLEETGPLPGLRVEAIGPELAYASAAVHQSAFGSPNFTDERWHEMAAGIPYSDARCLVGFGEGDEAVATVTVWSAGRGKPGLLEPMGVHADHGGRGYGKAISIAAASALREMGASSATVCTPSANVGAVATYRAAGFRPLPERTDRYRDA